MADIRDLQYLFLHFDVLEVQRSDSEHIQALLSAHHEHKEFLLDTHRHLLLWIEQLEEL
jgi:hypothetical protein